MVESKRDWKIKVYSDDIFNINSFNLNIRINYGENIYSILNEESKFIEIKKIILEYLEKVKLWLNKID